MMRLRPVRRAANLAAVVTLPARGCDSGVSGGTNGGIRGMGTDNTGGTVAGAAMAPTGNAQPARTTNTAWLCAMGPIESLRFIAHAPPIALLLQNGRLDSATSPGDAMMLHDAARELKTVLWYDAEHGLNEQALFDRPDGLHDQIVSPPD